MDMYGSLSNPPDCLRIDDDFLEFSDHSHSHLPPPLHHPFSDHPNFPSLPSEEAAELEWLAQFIDDTTSFPDFPLNHTIPIGSGSHTTSFLPNNRYNNANTDHNSNHKPSDVMEGNGGGEGEGGVRRCSHCASEKTPQWRTGPLGPKTLCNACGVRFKSGRLVPEYRPAASPTFVLTQHSNSHRKVMELRRQKELLRQHQQQQEHKHDFKVC